MRKETEAVNEVVQTWARQQKENQKRGSKDKMLGELRGKE